MPLPIQSDFGFGYLRFGLIDKKGAKRVPQISARDKKGGHKENIGNPVDKNGECDH